jgi:TonB-linked SusC/RagA family outer membrane protein
MRKFSLNKKVKESGMLNRMKHLLVLLLLLCTTAAFAQNVTVTGKVTDDTGEALIGVNVTVKRTTIGNITDLNGGYTLEIPGNQSVLVFSYVGYVTQEITVGNQRRIDVTLLDDSRALDEVVVVGYGVQKKETVTGSVSSVQGADLLKSPATNLSNSIAGRLAGVSTFQRTGEPGNDNTTIRIRGSNTLGNNDPLIVIDGVAARAGGLNRLDPNEIESMSVLKDASAAIYGARAANGVILITTKKGKTGKPKLTYSFNQGMGTPNMLPKMADAAQYAELRNELIVNDGMQNPLYGESISLPPWKTQEEIQKYRDGSDPWRYPNTDWVKATYADWSPQRTHTADLEGGTDKMSYYVNFGHRYQDGYWQRSANNYKQYNLRMNIDAELNDFVKVGVNLMGRQENRNYPSQGAGDVLWFTVRGRPTDPAFWPNGLPGPAQEYGRNPAVAASDVTGYDRDKRYYVQTNAYAEITQPWIDGLKLNVNIAYDKFIAQRKKWFQPWTLYSWDGISLEADGVTPKLSGGLNYPSHPDPRLDMYSEDQTNLVAGGILSYDKTWGNHGINLLVGTEKDQSDNEYFTAMRRYYLATAVQLFDAGGDKEKNASSESNDQWNKNWKRARMNYFGRIAYNYKEKYLAEFVWRYDASYMFPEDNRYGFFPGVLAGYRMSEENFWKENLSFIDYFKVRGSWGQMGNDQVFWDDRLQEYQFLETYKYAYGYIIDGADQKGLEISRFPNTNITWEVANNSNVGIELRTLKNRLSVEADYFYNKRSKILWRRNASIPQTAGLTLPAENIGEVENKGFDMKLEWSDRIGKDFSYRLSGTVLYSKNKITYWDEAPGAPDWQKSTGHSFPLDINNPDRSLLYVFDGVFKDWAEINDTKNRPNYDGITTDKGLQPGDMKFKDTDGNGEINPDDRVRYDTNKDPKWTYAFNASFQWKDFDLSFLFQGAADAWNRVYFDSGEIGNYHISVYENHWSVENPTDQHPRVHARGKYYWDSGQGQYNTYWLRKTDYLRLKNIEIGYSIPKHILEKTKFLSYARLYLNGNNLVTFTDFDYFDPEGDTASGNFIPPSKVINIGCTVTF